ncbi:MAG: adenosylhomocysteinase [Tissierellaceae bacterium]|nr:adenosylhomocysteinase [Tissierellaceae bacterium]
MRENLIRDINLAPSGHKKIDWVKGYMPVLSFIEKKFTEEQPLKGKKITMSIHLEAKTAYLAKVLKAGGADVTVTGSNPLSTQDDVASALAEDGLKVYAWYNSTSEEYNNHLNSALDIGPNIILDDGGDLVNLLHTTRQELIKNIIGGSEETTTGVLRLKAREREGKLKFPMISANGAYCKYLFDNRYGTGQSVWDGIMRTTNLIVAGKNVVVIGYGWCGKGVAMRAKGLGAKVIICEVNPIKAIEAHMDGFKVMPSLEAAKIGDIFITVTGDMKVLSKEHYKLMKNGAIMANAGHFDCEVWKPDLEEMSIEKREMRKNITGYVMPDKKILNLLAEGRLVNLAAGDGHPAEIMDMSFSIQALSIKYLINNAGKLENKVYDVPDEIDKEVATTKLKSMGIEIDRLTEEQEKYLKSW